ncbi:uncharacterized protein BDV17DRAFT_295700 [Aspergillus undulatus]|uniref:uncharacterized protein n=1 Tax=Aspergillus undulatus TaxID=1810928 RepID=UPI003CCD5876
MAIKRRTGYKVLIYLILANGAISVLDALTFVLYYAIGDKEDVAGARLWQPFICLVPMITPKLEFTILNRLLKLLQAPVTVADGQRRTLPGLSRLDRADGLASLQVETAVRLGVRLRVSEPGMHQRQLQQTTRAPESDSLVHCAWQKALGVIGFST